MAIQLPVNGGGGQAVEDPIGPLFPGGEGGAVATGPEAVGSPDGSLASNTYGDMNFTGGVSQLDGSPIVRYMPPGGGTLQTTTLASMKRSMDEQVEDGLLTEEERDLFYSDQNIDIEKNDDGTYSFGDISFTDARGRTMEFGRNDTGGFNRAQERTIPGTVGDARRRAEEAAARGTGAGSTSGGGGGGSSGRGGGGGGTSGGGGGGSTTTERGGIELGGGGGDGGGPPIDPNLPLGIDFDAARGGYSPGDQRFSDPSVFGRPTPFTEGLDQNATLNDILLGAMGEQRATRDLALGISGGLASTFEDSALRGGAEQGALGLMANPFSLDDATIQRIQGQQGELIGRNAERLGQASADRAASAGISRSGMQQADQDRIGINAARQLGDVQRGLLVEQATRRPQEIAQAVNLGSDVLQQQQGARERIAGGAIQTLQGTNLTGDAAVLGTLASGGAPQINIAQGRDTGPVGSRFYSGPAHLNPFN